jgi:glycosyltransferase involved in cell wall biosynthesis
MYHDIPEQSAWWDHAYFRALHRMSLARSDAVAVFSRFTAERVAARFPRIPAEHIRRIRPGPPDPEFGVVVARETVDATLRRLDVRTPCVLTVGAHPRKNVDIALRAIAAVGADTSLVLASASSDRAYVASLERLAAEIGVGRRFRVLRGASKSDLVALYRGAGAFAYVSSYEGIGIPPLEAMASGCPVVAARAGSIPEIVGDAALLVPPRDVDALTAALRRVLEDPDEAARLADAGRRVVAGLDWSSSASDLLDVAEAVVAR